MTLMAVIGLQLLTLPSLVIVSGVEYVVVLNWYIGRRIKIKG